MGTEPIIRPPTEDERQMYTSIVEAQSKYTYFKIAAALSAIAFTVHTTRGDDLAWSHGPYGMAVLMWTGSAVLGLQATSRRTMIKMLNLEGLAAHRGVSAILKGGDREALQHLSAAEKESTIRERVDELNAQIDRGIKDQWLLFGGGGVAFLVSHVLRMAGY